MKDHTEACIRRMADEIAPYVPPPPHKWWDEKTQARIRLTPEQNRELKEWSDEWHRHFELQKKWGPPCSCPELYPGSVY